MGRGRPSETHFSPCFEIISTLPCVHSTIISRLRESTVASTVAILRLFPRIGYGRVALSILPESISNLVYAVHVYRSIFARACTLSSRKMRETRFALSLNENLTQYLEASSTLRYSGRRRGPSRVIKLRTRSKLRSRISVIDPVAVKCCPSVEHAACVARASR